MFCNYSMLDTLYEIREVFFPLLGTNGFHVKPENEIFTAAGSLVVGTSSMKISRRHLADCVKKLHQKAFRTC